MTLRHALDLVPRWSAARRRTGRLVVLLDFDGTLAPLVPHPSSAAIPPVTRDALERLGACADVSVAMVSGRALADVQERAALPGIVYAGNHGLEIEGEGLRWTHPDARSARPLLDAVALEVAPVVAATDGAWIEDKGLTLTIHYRLAEPVRFPRLREAVAAAVSTRAGVRMTEGSKVLEIRPEIGWDKGRAALFLLEQMRPPVGAPVLYLGDDATDEDAFRALRGWRTEAEGIVVSHDHEATGTAARSFVRSVEEVGALLAALADR